MFLACVSGLGALVPLLLIVLSPLLHLRGRVLLVTVVAAGAFSLTAVVCGIIACVRLRHRQTPAKILSWIAVPLAALLLSVHLTGASHILAAAAAETRVEAEGRYSLTRPDSDWTFLPRPVTGERAEMEMVRMHGPQLHVVTRTGRGRNNASELLDEIARLWTLPSMRQHHHHHGHHAREEGRGHVIRSVEILIGDETAAGLRELFGREIETTSRVLERKRSTLKTLKEDSGSPEAVRKAEQVVEWYEISLERLTRIGDAGALSLIVRRLAGKRPGAHGAAYLGVWRGSPPPMLGGEEAVRMLVKGRTARGEEFVQIIQFAVRRGTSYVVECFAPAAEGAQAQAAFDRVVAGFRFIKLQTDDR